MNISSSIPLLPLAATARPDIHDDESPDIGPPLSPDPVYKGETVFPVCKHTSTIATSFPQFPALARRSEFRTVELLSKGTLATGSAGSLRDDRPLYRSRLA